MVRQILKKSSGLKNSELYQKVYLCPDRSEEERAEQRRLVTVWKRKCEEPDRNHFIKYGTVHSREKDTGDGGGETGKFYFIQLFRMISEYLVDC